MSDEISVAEAARRLGASPPTIRGLLDSGRLSGRRKPRGSRFVWSVDGESVERFRSEHGPFGGRRRPQHSVASLAAEVESLRLALDSTLNCAVERDDLRATLVTLRDALAQTRDVLQLQREADDARADMVQHLLDALAAGERADNLRRGALERLEAAVGTATGPGHPGELGPERDSG